MENGTRGRDMSAPVEFITLNGTQYKTVYNNQTARIAEDVYEQQYGKDVGYGEILKGIAKGKYSAIMALQPVDKSMQTPRIHDIIRIMIPG